MALLLGNKPKRMMGEWIRLFPNDPPTISFFSFFFFCWAHFINPFISDSFIAKVTSVFKASYEECGELSSTFITPTFLMQKKIGRAIDSDVAPPRMSRLYVNLSFLQNDKKKNRRVCDFVVTLNTFTNTQRKL